MDYTLENIKSIDRGVNKTFANGLKSGKGQDYKEYASVVTSKNRIQSYTWLGDIPAMEEWIDERQRAQLSDYKYDIEKKDWETSFYVTRDDVIFDNLGVVPLKVDSLLDAVNDHYEEITAQMLVENGKCFDGKNFFGSHVVKVKDKNVTYNNLSTHVLTEDNVDFVIAEMKSIKKTNGKPARIKPSHIYVAPDLEKKANKIFKRNMVDGSDNASKDLLQVRVMDDFPAGAWCVMDNTRPVKPIILQITKKADKVDRLTQNPLEGKKIYYGVDTMDNAGYSFWQLAHYCTGEAPTEEAAA